MVFKPVVIFVFIAALIGEYFSPYLDQLADSRRDYLRKGESALDSTSGFWAREGSEFIHFNAVFSKPNWVVCHYINNILLH